MGISCEGFEEQFRALLIAIELNRFSATKRDRELRRLTYSVNYDSKERNVSHDRSKGKGTNMIL